MNILNVNKRKRYCKSQVERIIYCQIIYIHIVQIYPTATIIPTQFIQRNLKYIHRMRIKRKTTVISELFVNKKHVTQSKISHFY